MQSNWNRDQAFPRSVECGVHPAPCTLGIKSIRCVYPRDDVTAPVNTETGRMERCTLLPVTSHAQATIYTKYPLFSYCYVLFRNTRHFTGEDFNSLSVWIQRINVQHYLPNLTEVSIIFGHFQCIIDNNATFPRKTSN